MLANLYIADLVIIIISLAIILLIGILAGYKIKSFSDYTKSYQSYSPGILGISLSMVLIGSAGLFSVFRLSQQDGIIYAVTTFGYIINSLITAKYIIPRFDSRFKDSISVCEVFSYFYGRSAEGFSAVISLIFDTGAAATGFIVLGSTISYSCNLTFNTSIFIAALFAICYSAAGGIRAITVLESIKCLLVVIFIPILSNFVTFNAGGFLHVLKNTDSSMFDLALHMKFSHYCLLFLFFLLPTHLIQPVVTQRVLLINNPDLCKQSFYIYALFRIALLWMVVTIAFASLLHYPGMNLIQVIIAACPSILRGFALVTVFVMILSKTDAHLNSASIIATRSCLRIHNNSSVRYMIAVIGIISCCIAVTNIYVIDIIIFIEAIWSVFVGLPLIAGLFGFNLEKKSFLLYVLMIIPAGIFYIFFSLHNASLLMIALALVIFLLLYRHDNNASKLVFSFKLSKNNLLLRIRHTASYLYRFCPKILSSSDDADYFAFSVFFSVIYTFTFFMWDFTKQELSQIIFLRMLVIILCFFLLIKPLWPKRYLKYFSLYWHLTLMITLPFTSLFILIIEDWSIICMINVILSIFLLALLTSWLSFIILLICGISTAFAWHYLFLGRSVFSSQIHLNYMALYVYFFAILIVLIFTRRKQNMAERELQLANILGGVIAHELRTYLLTIRNYVSSSYPIPAKNIENTLDKAFSFIDIFLINIKGPNPALNMSTLSIKSCVNAAITEYPLSQRQKDLIHICIDHDFVFLGNKAIISHVIFNLINNALYYATNRNNFSINIYTRSDSKFNYLICKDNGPGIAPGQLSKIFDKFYSKGKKGSGLGLPFCKLSMTLIGGDILCNSIEGGYTEFILIFPSKAL